MTDPCSEETAALGKVENVGNVAARDIAWSALPDATREKVQRLQARLQRLPLPILAFSGGVDSSVVAAMLKLTHGQQCLLVTAIGPSLAERQRAIAQRVAQELGLPHRWLETRESQDPGYRRNQADRCYYCKSHLFDALTAIASRFPDTCLLSGTNHDDLSDHRPGLQAANQHRVIAPLAEAGLGKAEVRGLAQALGLSVHDLPAAPCLASRIAYGVAVTPGRLEKIEQAEGYLWAAGFSDVRVRLLAGEVARIEVPLPELPRLQAMLSHPDGNPDPPGKAGPSAVELGTSPNPWSGSAELNGTHSSRHTPCAVRPQHGPESAQLQNTHPPQPTNDNPSGLLQQIQNLGFRHVIVDPMGLRSGNLNQAIGQSDRARSLPILPE